MGLFSRRKDDPSEDVAPLDGVGEAELIEAEVDDALFAALPEDADEGPVVHSGKSIDFFRL